MEIAQFPLQKTSTSLDWIRSFRRAEGKSRCSQRGWNCSYRAVTKTITKKEAFQCDLKVFLEKSSKNLQRRGCAETTGSFQST